MIRFLVIIGLLFIGSDSLIVPGELPTILSLIYSNIPTIKKGTDSRLGWGFRLGNRADFQFLVELGPQTNTQPIGSDQSSTSAKRHSPESLKDVLWAQRQHEKREKLIEKQTEKQTEKPEFSKTDGGNWLKQWSESMRPKIEGIKVEKVPNGKENLKSEEESPVLGIGEVDAKLVIPEDEEDEINLIKKVKNK